jgi:hypothetical protein
VLEARPSVRLLGVLDRHPVTQPIVDARRVGVQQLHVSIRPAVTGQNAW